METQIKKLFEENINSETYEDLYECIKNSSIKKRKIHVTINNIIELLEELLPYFVKKKFMFFLLSILLKRFKKILDDINKI